MNPFRILGVCALLTGALLFALACASRPPPRHPQPEDGLRAQAEFVACALLDAYFRGDAPRLKAYVAPEWRDWSAAGGAPAHKSEELPAWLSARLAVVESAASLDAVIEAGRTYSASRYDLQYQGKETSLPLSGLLKQMAPKDILVVVYPKGRGEEGRLLLLFRKIDGKLVLRGVF